MRPVRVEPYPGEALAVSAGEPPSGEFGDPPEGFIDLHTPAGCDEKPPSVLLAFAVSDRARCGWCGKRPGTMVLTEPGGTWHLVTKHDPSCPESAERRGRHEALSMIQNQQASGLS
jgi:hypothetical protein